MDKFQMLSAFPRLLVLGTSLPGSKHGGGVVRSEILKRYPRDRYVCFATEGVHAPGLGVKEDLPDCLRGIPCRVGPLIPDLHLRGSRFYLPILRAIGFSCMARLRVRQAVSLARRYGVELVWAELYGDGVVLAEEVASQLGVPFVATVWDDPEGWFADRGYDRFSRRILQRKFKSALLAARNVSTAGEVMQRVYKQEYGIQSVILRHGFKSPVFRTKDPQSNKEIIVGFVGSAYGRDAWTAFLSAVANLNASGKLPRIRLRVFGGGAFPYSHPGIEIDTRGWQPSDVMLRELAEADFCYLPYWFEPSKRRHVELSFPNKFETYLAAGRPVVFHGPVYAGIAEAVKQYGVGICIHTLREDEIIANVERLITDQPIRESFEKAAISAFHAEFNAKAMMRKFSALIGVDPSIFRTGAGE